MSQDESITIVPEEEVYEKIEKAVLVIPEVSHFTADGFQDMISGISQAFGFHGHKGLLLRRSRKKGIKVDISLALHRGCRVNETGRYVQMVVRNLLLTLTDETIYGIDVTITDIVD
nr:hypothetical protein [uncultured Dialister sp.]